MNNAESLGVLVLAIVVLVAFGYFMSYMSGWSEAARIYPGPSHFPGPLYMFRSAGCRRVTHYGMCLVFGANSLGLYIAILPWFRVGHPPIFVPWRDVTIARYSTFGIPTARFSFARTPSVWFAVWPRLASRLLASAPISAAPVAAA